MSGTEFQITGNSTPCPVLQQRKHRRSVLRVFCEGNPSVATGFPTQRASNAECFCMSWRHHVHASHGSRNSAELVISCAQVMRVGLLDTDTFIWPYAAYGLTAGSTWAFCPHVKVSTFNFYMKLGNNLCLMCFITSIILPQFAIQFDVTLVQNNGNWNAPKAFFHRCCSRRSFDPCVCRCL